MRVRPQRIVTSQRFTSAAAQSPARCVCELCGDEITYGQKIYQPDGQAPMHAWCKFGNDGP